MVKRSNGVLIYRGPSEIDGEPIVVIATGLANGSSNTKTGGGLIQTWILREDVSPTDAVNTGDDVSICGTCPHRGTIVDGRNIGRSCYVTVFQAPLNVWKSYHRGIYPDVSNDLTATFAGRGVRLGAYGDPAAIPLSVWDKTLASASYCTGYTHQWRAVAPSLSKYCMASADSAADRFAAKALGYRTFRVQSRADHAAEGEIICPASAEAGHKTTCDVCRACGGLGAKAKADIVIAVHGSAAKVNAAERRVPA
jgi:hypothetical protein